MSFAIKVALLALLLPVSLVRAEQNSLESLVGTEIPAFQCNMLSGGSLTKDGIAQLKKVREKANKYCLACRGDECIAKQWPEDRVQELQLCQSLYCVPARFPKTMLSDQRGWAPHTANVVYKVEKNGRGKLLSYTATENAEAIRSYKKEINQSVGSFLRNTRFVPLIVDGERKELVNLYYTVNIYNRN
ncbi:MAG TPA: hypothetical protein DDW59_05740 [Gammaproteobacteria bacterium]|nr:hypothetical protein [Gammaproteobacteria bacterium]|tara:strand:- start:185 stop:748 length:564 start_codon:yes stop_codon:yes gene_type:complete